MSKRLVVVVLLLGAAIGARLVAQGTLPMTSRVISNRSELEKIELWDDMKGRIVRPQADTATLPTELLDGKTVTYRSSVPPGLQLAVMFDSATGTSYVVRGLQTVYIVHGDDLLSCLSIGVEMLCAPSYLKMQTMKRDDVAVVKRLLSVADDQQLSRIDRSAFRVDLRRQIPSSFFMVSLSDMYYTPRIDIIRLKDGILHLVLTSPDQTKGKAVVDIDLESRRLVGGGVVQDGKAN